MLGGGLSGSLKNYIANTLSVNSFPINSPESISLGDGTVNSPNFKNIDNKSAKFGLSIWGLTQISTEYKPNVN